MASTKWKNWKKCANLSHCPAKSGTGTNRKMTIPAEQESSNRHILSLSEFLPTLKMWLILKNGSLKVILEFFCTKQWFWKMLLRHLFSGKMRVTDWVNDPEKWNEISGVGLPVAQKWQNKSKKDLPCGLSHLSNQSYLHSEWDRATWKYCCHTCNVFYTWDSGGKKPTKCLHTLMKVS